MNDVAAFALIALFLGGFGFLLGSSYGRDAERQQRCEEKCAPRQASHDGPKCFCLEERP